MSGSSLSSSSSHRGDQFDFSAAELSSFRVTTPKKISDFDLYSSSRHSVLAEIGLEVHEMKQALGMLDKKRSYRRHSHANNLQEESYGILTPQVAAGNSRYLKFVDYGPSSALF